MTFEGTAHVYGDNVDTDVIIPARYLTSNDPDEIGIEPPRLNTVGELV